MAAAESPREPDLDDIRDAAARIAPFADPTPVLRSRSIDRMLGASLFFKAEHLQRSGAFKFRGACNAVFSLDEDTAQRGVVTQSSGNHGAAVALAAALRGIPARVVVPEGAPGAKLRAIRLYGAMLTRCAPGMAARDAACAEILAATGGELVHPFDDARVIAGQGTATLELMTAVPGLDLLIAPVSGGGLLSGTAIAAKSLDPAIAVWGAEPAGAADAAASLARGERVTEWPVDTVCDGLRAILGRLPFAILAPRIERIVTVPDADTLAAMRLVYERMKQVIEPSAAVALAALLARRDDVAGRRIGVILSGGNLDLDALPWSPETQA